MRRRLIVMITLTMLIISVIAMNVTAASGYYNYGCSHRTRLGCEWNGSGQDWTFYAKAVPTGGGVTRLQLCDYTGVVVYAQGDYPLNPTNPNYISCTIEDNGYIATYVKPIPEGTYISGKVYWAF